MLCRPTLNKRRVNAVQFDVRYIESNANAFNEPGSLITRSAKMLSYVILEYIKSHDCHDIMPLLTDLSKGEEFSWDRSQSDSESSNSSNKPNTKRVCRQKGGKSTDPESWREECKDLLETMLECQDSEPFRTPVNPIDYPDYEDIIDEPMDLGILGSNLERGHYKDPLEFIKHTRLIFKNSRTYNTNKRSKIYIMTLRLSSLFEEHIREILKKWRRSSKRGKLPVAASSKSKTSTSQSSKSSVRKTLSSSRDELSVGEVSGPSRPRLSPQIHSGSTTELDSDTPVRKTSNPSLRKRSTAQSAANTSECTSQMMNGHSQPYTTRSSTGTRKRKKLTSSSSGSSSSSSSTSSNSDTEIEGASPKSNSLKTARIGRPPPTKPSSSSSDEASDNSRTEYEENKSDSDQDKIVRRTQRARQSNETRKKTGSTRGGGGKPPHAKRPHVLYSEEEETDKAEVDNDDTDDEDYVLDQPKRRSVRESRTNNHNRRSVRESRTNNHNRQSKTESSQQSRTRNRGQRTVHYEENSDDESSSSEFVTLSSRGRLRRLTPRARASLLGE